MPLDFMSNPGKEDKDVFFEKLRSFVVSHESNLQKMEQVFDAKWDITTWDAETDAATVSLGQHNDMTTVADTLGRSKLNNRLFFVMTMQMTSLATEMRNLAEECHDTFIPPLCMYGESALLEDGITDEDAQRGLGKLLPLLQDVWNWVQRSNKVLVATFRNFGALYSMQHQRDNYYPYTMVHFPLVWHAIADLLAALVMIEEVLNDHDTMRQGLHVFRRILETVSKNYEKFDADEFHVEQFGKLLKKLQTELLDDGIVERIAMQILDTKEVSIHSNSTFFAEFNAMFGNMIRTVDEFMGTGREGEGRRKYIGLCGLFLVQYHMFKPKLTADPDVFRTFCGQIFAIHRKCPVVHIFGLNVIKPGQWLARKVPSNSLATVVRDPVKESMLSIKAECTRSAQEFLPKLRFLTTICSVWIAQMESSYPSDRNHAKQYISTLTQLLIRGVQFAQDLNKTIRNIIFVHQAADLALTRSIVEGIALAVEQLMMLRNALHNKTAAIASMFSILVQSVSYAMNGQLFAFYSRLNDVLQTAGESVTDQHTAIGQAMALLAKPQSPQNLACLDIVLSIAFQRGDCYFTPKDFEPIMSGYNVICRLCGVQKQMAQATNCDFLFWQREGFIPIFLSGIYKAPAKAHNLVYLVEALHDARPAILSSKHADGAEILTKYKAFLKTSLHDALVEPLCTEIENDLRLHTHGAVLGQPFRRIERSTRDPSLFTTLKAFRFFDEWVSIAHLVEDYLDVQFYNLNALMANDWKTYEEMRNLAKERYGLRIAEGYLPGSIVDQGLDVLVITKNIHVFVANYTYNMNEQIFVQRPAVTESKHLNTLHIRHVANSIRTHGTGIMNTTVNYVYKCLLKKLAILSQFLFDDHIKSRLLKDIKFFAANKEKTNGQYPINRAEKFANDMKKLGVTEDGRTCLDQFRQLVAEIGNALGYMRMVRSGGLRSIAEAAVFIPALVDIPHLETFVNPELAEGKEEEDELMEAIRIAKAEAEGRDPDDSDEEEEKETAPPETIGSIRIVDEVVANMTKRLAQGSDYFKMLEEAIARKLNDEEKYSHLRNFYMIIPPMTIQHVEFMIRQKEQLVKKNKEGLFTDDGFTLGCVFLLSLFGNVDNFESLHWFEAVQAHYANRKKDMAASVAERERREAERKKLKKVLTPEDEEADNDLKTMQLTLTMVDGAVREYSDIDNAYHSARVFFRYNVDEEPEEEEEEEEDD